MRHVVLDTDVASLLLKGGSTPMAKRLEGQPWSVSMVTLGEMVRWAETHDWGPWRWAGMLDWLRKVTVIPNSAEVAYAWGQLSAAAKKRGRPRPQNDMWIAATCLVRNAPLATLNHKDYIDFVELHDLRLVLE